jgi:hypothetical protein
MRSLQDVQKALIEKQARLITVQEQLLERLRKFGDEGASSLHREVGDIHLAVELLEREHRELQPSRPSTCAILTR